MKIPLRQKSRYAFIAIFFLLIALSAVFIILFFSGKNSRELKAVVHDLSYERYDVNHIDKAIQLLYEAENNSRLYILTQNPENKETYLGQLNQVSMLIDSIRDEDNSKLHSLVENKRLKTASFVKARLLADSIIQVLVSAERQGEKGQSSPGTEQYAGLKTNTGKTKIVSEEKVKERNSKGLFGRIKDAIINKPKEVKKVIISTTASDPSGEQLRPVSRLHHHQAGNLSVLGRLPQKEKDLLQANSMLFGKLQGLLGRFKQDESEVYALNQSFLKKSADKLMDNLHADDYYHFILGIVLIVVVLLILLMLYKNDILLQQEKAKAEDRARYIENFVATLSHEIRTPLHSIRSFSDELSDKNTREERNDIIDAIKISSTTLLSVVNNALDYAKMEKGRFRLARSPFVPLKIIQEVLTGLKLQASKKDIQVIEHITSSVDQTLYGDAFHLRQLLINLTNNAIKYTDKGSITLTADFRPVNAVGGTLHISIEDTGVGLAKDKLKQIFDRFSSLNHDGNIAEGSTGLGLSIVKRIIDHHKGDIQVKSKINTGTTFSVNIPYDKYYPIKETDQSAPKDFKGSRHVLVIEDNLLNSKALTFLLERENYHVTNMQDGASAFELFTKESFDFVITDISLPGLNGFELAEKIRQLPDNSKSSVPIIAISGYDDEDFSKVAHTFNARLNKPFDAKELLEKIKAIKRNKI